MELDKTDLKIMIYTQIYYTLGIVSLIASLIIHELGSKGNGAVVLLTFGVIFLLASILIIERYLFRK